MTLALVRVLGSLVLNSLHYGHTEEAQRAVVTLLPDWPRIYREEKITLRCTIENGGDADWEYSWRTNSSITPAREQEYSISAYMFHSGHYRCRGRNTARKESRTKWSDPVKLTVFGYLPKPDLSVSPSWLRPGAPVTLSCGVEQPSAGWTFHWYRAVPDLSHGHRSYRTEPLPGSVNGTAEHFYVLPAQTHTAQFMCRAGRGDFYTHLSEPTFVWSSALDMAASLTVSPDRAQHFFSESVSLSCEGTSSVWRVMRFTETGPSRCHGWGIMTGPTCTVHSLQYGDAVYWCESASGEFSNAVNITVLSPRPESSSLTVPLLAGVTTAVFLLLLLHRVTKCSDPCRNRSTQTRSNKHQQMSPAETQQHVYSFLRHGDVCIYDSIGGFDATGNEAQAKECSRLKVHSAQLETQGGDKGSKTDNQTTTV